MVLPGLMPGYAQGGGDADPDAVLNADTSTAEMAFVIDEDSFATNTATKVPSQQSVKAYVDLKAPIASPTFTGTVTLPVGLTGVIRTDTGVVSADADVTDIVAAASATAAGKVELATTAETETGTDTTRSVTPDGLHDMTTLAGAAWFLDEDAMTSNSAVKTSSQQAIKAYVDAQAGGGSAFQFDVSGYGAVGDGVADDTVAVQAAIDACAAAGGGSVFFSAGTYLCNCTLAEGVYLFAENYSHGVGYSDIGSVTLKAKLTGVVIDTPVASTMSCGIVGINVQGLGAGTAVVGIRFRAIVYGVVRNVSVNNCSDQGILVNSGSGACVFENILCVNCVLDRTQAAIIGAFDIDGNDHFAREVESTISGSAEGTKQSANLYHTGIVWRATNCYADGIIGEISDVGIVVSGAYNRFVGCRADLNYGHGWVVSGANNQFSVCLALDNSQDTTNTYSGLVAGGTKNQFSGFQAASTVAKVHKYGIEDTVSSATNKNTHTNPASYSAGTAQFIGNTSNGSAWFWAVGPARAFTNGDTTPDVSGYLRFETANSGATTISAFDGGVPGQLIEVICTDSNTKIAHNGAGFTLFGVGDKKLRSGVVYRFYTNSGTNWREIVDFPLGVSADNGNAAKTLVTRQTEETQVWATVLTADRAVTLDTYGAYSGSKFRIVRTAAATGAFNLNVGTGPLKALAPGTWCDVEWNSAWVLTAYGAL